MGLGMEKCCCFIPLRSGTLIISIWFFIVYSFDIIACFTRVNAFALYAAQSAWLWLDIYLILSFFAVLSGLIGVFGLCLSMVSIILILTHRDTIIRTCLRSGIISYSNPMELLQPANITESSFYSPVQYPRTLNAHAESLNECRTGIGHLINLFIVLVVLFSFLQIYFGFVVRAYAGRLTKGARHHRLHDQQIKDFEDSRNHMSTLY
ncbi:hypothetical protein PHYBLDRAFT_143433 [Phycomyces blakesleeanus NRRL 1555(-)]|uniref:Uncharacterized protein n=1 Tax=Phycomyces blakesleeanus (strain ATCC 8743b / DSM 1359 / FGSC 10004 / NBRC 33097 / NRRL 1555) TaxID=763407 RepID=A0A167NQL6_PHYB8|nr:hypothetical protein PHYBLDRAFT_143433 [Phycomyces blakesleeanus NRRL 1555(-)]OAD76464.1 hypothetical protein PHYBLDRAFT_143433 [Phycomyces blakesleeanus NRRL 1555(-)]|eukprot:XP_018294504.1 hypothetical protein PHYBLDRAFT_143433 [Phycomyces blakesleeanus NRRL 1555(-)]